MEHDANAPTETARRLIIEELYTEAMVLADEARELFDQRGPANPFDDETKIALSIEGLRTTTRMMNMLAWLLNRRAFLDGELNERQVRESGRLPLERPRLPGMFEKLPPMIRSLIRDTERLHDRIGRIDSEWRFGERQSEVAEMQSRLHSAFAA